MKSSITTDHWTQETVSEFRYGFISKNLGEANSFLILTIGGQTGIEGEERQVSVYASGSKANGKVDYEAAWSIEHSAVAAMRESGNYYGACLAYINEGSKYMASIVLDIEDDTISARKFADELRGRHYRLGVGAAGFSD
ncbi:MAG: hypothetical protein LBU32_20950 [Clostridiales bacterium]|jgi:hypothetical protein|nr:hypothetical protein [Clostridiales bacterium]